MINSEVIRHVRNCSGTTLRKTRNIATNMTRYYSVHEELGKVRARRVSAETYNYINDVLARSKCAFTTHIDDKRQRVQYTHSVTI